MTPMENPTTPSVDFWQRRAKICMVGLYVLAAVWGGAQVVAPDNRMAFFIAAFLAASLATQWAIFDSRVLGRPILPILQMLYFFVWPLGALVYLITARGWRGVILALAHGVGLTVTHVVAIYGTYLPLYFAGLVGNFSLVRPLLCV